MKIAYIRVSTAEQNTIRQEVLMETLEVDKIFIDRASGKNMSRPELQTMLEYVREGDTVIVESYSRLARSTRDLLNIVEMLENKHVNFVSKKEAIDTSTPSGRLMLTLFAGLYQFERECSLERQAEGIKEARKAGKYKGRKPIHIDETEFVKQYNRWQSGEITAVAALRGLREKGYKLSANTFYRRVKVYEKKGSFI
jgi:DNA invertase Pin-like site-specific DNA recombinase